MAFNLSAFAGAGAQFFDSNGTPLAGGLLYVYTAGTTTPATTWTTNSGAVANTNPIVLNAAGRTPNEIWLNSGVTYKFALYTSTSVLIGTYDNIPAIDDPTAFNNLITVTGTNTLVGSSTPPYTAYVAGMTLSFIPVNTNTGAVTLDVDGLGAKNIYAGSSTPLIGSELVAGRIVQIEYDGVRFQLYQSSVSIPDGAVTTAKLADGAVTTVKMAAGAATGAALGTDVIKTTGTQTIGGAKTFTSPVTFNDTTQQNTAFVGAANAQVFTSGGTFTVPTGITKVRVTLFGGGGGGGNTSVRAGGPGGCGIAVLSGLTPGGSITVTIGAGGAGVSGSAGAATLGGTGGTTSFGALASATGGGGSSTAVTGSAGTFTTTGTVLVKTASTLNVGVYNGGGGSGNQGTPVCCGTAGGGGGGGLSAGGGGGGSSAAGAGGFAYGAGANGTAGSGTAGGAGGGSAGGAGGAAGGQCGGGGGGTGGLIVEW